MKIKFTKKCNFWHIASVARNKNVNDYEILNQAFEQDIFEEENKIFLKKFIDQKILNLNYIKIFLHHLYNWKIV